MTETYLLPARRQLEHQMALVSAIRAASNRLEAISPIPLDFKADQYWP
jgi:hypothetical protein